MRFRMALIGLLFFSQNLQAESSINLGIGLDYTPIALLRYDNNHNADYDIVDNTAWQGRLSYGFGNGFKSGLLFDYMSKTIHPGSYTTTDLSLWGLGAYGDYGYEITESGHALLVAGMETGYGELTDKSVGISKSAGAIWIAGLVGTRFLIGGKVWLETDYRLGWQEFEIPQNPQRRYRFSGSSLRVSLEYPIFTIPDRTEDK